MADMPRHLTAGIENVIFPTPEGWRLPLPLPPLDDDYPDWGEGESCLYIGIRVAENGSRQTCKLVGVIERRRE